MSNPSSSSSITSSISQALPGDWRLQVQLEIWHSIGQCLDNSGTAAANGLPNKGPLPAEFDLPSQFTTIFRSSSSNSSV